MINKPTHKWMLVGPFIEERIELLLGLFRDVVESTFEHVLLFQLLFQDGSCIEFKFLLTTAPNVGWDIDAILRDYGVPSLPLMAEPATK